MDATKAQKLIENLKDGAMAGRVSRRQFMEGAAAAGLTAAAASTLWSTKVEAATPQWGGSYHIGMHDGNTTDSLDPGTTEAVYMIQLSHTTRNYLTEQKANGDITGEIAESWDATPDAKTWSFKIRKGVEFHNGKTVTPQDVVDSLNYHRGEDSKSAAKSQLAAVEDIKVDGDSVVLSASSGFADMPYMLTDYHLVILPSNGDGTIDWQSGIGTGAYKIESHEPGVSTQMVKHENFFKSDAGYFDDVQYTVINDPNARGTALKTGAVDAVTTLDLKTVGLMGRDPNIEIDDTASGSHVTIPMFCDTAPFDNLDVRLALKYGFPREEAVQKIMKGYATIGNDSPIGPSIPYYHEMEQRQYDPDKAKFHLKQAGVDGISVDLSASDSAFPGAVDTATLFQESARQSGIEINVVREPNDGYWSNVWLVKPFVFVQWGQRPTPDVMFSLAYKKGADWNESHWENARFNELLDAAKGELDQAKRTEMYAEMQRLCRDDGGTIVPWFTNRVSGRQKAIQHPEIISGIWELDGARSAERWWRVS